MILDEKNNTEIKEVWFKNILDKFWVKEIFWISLIVWVYYQTVSLSIYWKLNFFSWSQVINDTAILLPAFIILFISFYDTSSEIVLWQKKWPTVKECFKDAFLNKKFIIFWILFALFYIMNIKFGSVLMSLYTSFLVIWMLIKIVLAHLIWTISYENFKYHLKRDYFLIVIIILLISYYIINIINNAIYNKETLITEVGKEYKINYMNDKYIFTDNWIFQKTDKMSFK